ncbi:response regulator, partial [bacterium]|nr:response regulator [bacterium]
DILDEINQIFHLTMEGKKIEFKIELDPDIPKALILDKVRLKQILLNLVGNAQKFTKQGSILIKVETLRLEGVNLDLVICVKDTGIGIAPKNINNIFEAFKQQDGHDAHEFGGTGLGLAISRSLAQQMGGEISVKSSVGKGSIFKLILKNIPISSPNTLQKDRKNKFLFEKTTFQHASVLVVDDVASNRAVMLEILTHLGLDVRLAGNGEEALHMIGSDKPDIVFMDIRMPVLDGIQAMKKIRANPEQNDIPIIALSASSADKDIKDIILAGFDAYFGKPFSSQELIKVLAKFIKIKPVREQNTVVSLESVDLNLSVCKEQDELLNTFNKIILPACSRLKTVMVMSQIEDFGQKLIILAKQHDVSGLFEVGTRLIENAQIFDTKKIVEDLDRLAVKIDKLNTTQLK